MWSKYAINAEYEKYIKLVNHMERMFKKDWMSQEEMENKKN